MKFVLGMLAMEVADLPNQMKLILLQQIQLNLLEVLAALVEVYNVMNNDTDEKKLYLESRRIYLTYGTACPGSVIGGPIPGGIIGGGGIGVGKLLYP